ncbi:peroxiredoxin [Candidatus Woesearchaeota archaeon]|nr:peroxiredoxin [Candidatus Woesearchaeota archaeon]
MKHAESHNLGSAPDFDLPDQNGNVVCLTDFEDKWLVIYFYPKDNTTGCTLEAMDFSKKIKEFEKLKTCIIGISPDTCESHCDFIKKNNICVTLLCDLGHKVADKYKVWKEKIERSTFIINPEGNLVHEWRGVQAQGHVEEVLKKLKELQKK